MALVKTWYAPQEAGSQFGIDEAKILEWVDEGLVRCEREGETVVRVNIDDVRLEAEAMVREQP